MKRSRQKAILTILNQRRITTQEQLRDALLEQGIRVTQATLSRDIAELGLTKDENGEDVCVSVDDDDEFEKVSAYFDETLIPEFDMDELPEENG